MKSLITKSDNCVKNETYHCVNEHKVYYGRTKLMKRLFLTEEETSQNIVIKGFQIEVITMTEKVTDHGEEIGLRMTIEK